MAPYRGAKTRIVDARGHAVIPGLVDPTVRELNEAAPDTPVFVLFLYNRGMLNRAGVAAMRLTPQTKAPEGGRFEFVAAGCGSRMVSGGSLRWIPEAPSAGSEAAMTV